MPVLIFLNTNIQNYLITIGLISVFVHFPVVERLIPIKCILRTLSYVLLKLVSETQAFFIRTEWFALTKNKSGFQNGKLLLIKHSV